jgi:hypothetical protein
MTEEAVSKVIFCHCEILFPANKQNKPTKTSDRRSITLARRSVSLRRAEVFNPRRGCGRDGDCFLLIRTPYGQDIQPSIRTSERIRCAQVNASDAHK